MIHNKIIHLLYKSISLLGFVFIINLGSIAPVNAAFKDGMMSVTVRVIGTCLFTVGNNENVQSQDVTSQCDDNSLGYTQTDKWDIQSEEVDADPANTKKGTSDDSINSKKQVGLNVGQEENIKAGVKVKTILFFG